jgi:hypothetical protein
MQHIFGKKALLAGAIAAVVTALFAGAAIAAPVLQPGTTSAPGMSGTCTNCHTYAKPAKPKVSAPSHPYVSKGKHRASKSLRVFGYISPRLSGAQESTLTVYAYTKVNGSWVTTDSLTTTGTISAKGSFKRKTNYAATLHLEKAGKYRLRTRLVFVDAKGVKHDKWSKIHVVRIYKAK